MVRISSATSGVITVRTTSVFPSWRTFPSGLVTFLTIYGFTRLPPLAMAQMARSIWSGVTAIPCPMAMVATSEGTISLGLYRIPASSPGTSLPVALPKPKALAYWVSRSPPSFRPRSAIPVFRENLITSVKVTWPMPLPSQFRIRRPPTSMDPWSLKGVLGVMTPSISPADPIMGLNTDPGS